MVIIIPATDEPIQKVVYKRLKSETAPLSLFFTSSESPVTLRAFKGEAKKFNKEYKFESMVWRQSWSSVAKFTKKGEGKLELKEKGEAKRDDEGVVVKVYNRAYLKSRGNEGVIERELVALKMLKHRNVVTLLSHFNVLGEAGEEAVFVLEECATSLDRLKVEELGGGMIDAHQIFLQVAKGLKYIHGKGMIHGDVKPANILISHKGDAKIADFGCSLQVTHGGEEFMQQDGYTKGYKPIETVLHNLMGFKSDCWALGISMLKFLSGEKEEQELENVEQFEELGADVKEFFRFRETSMLNEAIKSSLRLDYLERSSSKDLVSMLTKAKKIVAFIEEIQPRKLFKIVIVPTKDALKPVSSVNGNRTVKEIPNHPFCHWQKAHKLKKRLTDVPLCATTKKIVPNIKACAMVKQQDIVQNIIRKDVVRLNWGQKLVRKVTSRFQTVH